MTARTALALPLLFGLAGCDAITGKGGSVSAPSVAFNGVTLVDGPSQKQALAWTCYTYLSDSACQIAGYDSKPDRDKMTFTFDLVFDLTNENAKIPIPLVELLLGITVIKTENLGSVCVSFCDPDEEDCTPGYNVEGACVVDEDTTVDEPSDLVPTVDDLVGLVEDVVAGDVDNGQFRVIPPGESVESHIQFALDPVTVWDLGESLFNDALEDAIAGDPIHLEVPYTVEGTAFFDVPEMGRFAAGFGPFEDAFPIE